MNSPRRELAQLDLMGFLALSNGIVKYGGQSEPSIRGAEPIPRTPHNEVFA